MKNEKNHLSESLLITDSSNFSNESLLQVIISNVTGNCIIVKITHFVVFKRNGQNFKVLRAQVT